MASGASGTAQAAGATTAVPGSGTIRHRDCISNGRDIKRRKISQARIVVPARQQFRNILATIRESDGRADSRAKAKPGADFVELLAYSGCRLHEAASLRWRDVDFEKGALTVSGGERGTKNDETRTVPMTDALRTLLLRLRDERQP